MIKENTLSLKGSYKNPFSEYNANVMEPETILSYWCSPFSFMQFAGVKESDVYSDKMPIVFVGGRGTGKTMFLKYFSFPVQIQEAIKSSYDSTPTLSFFEEKGAIGFYLRIDGPKLRSFSGSGINDETWLSIFTHFFELEVGQAYLTVIQSLDHYGVLDKISLSKKFVPQVDKLLGNSVNKKREISDVLEDVADKLEEVTNFRAAVRFSDVSFQPSKAFSSQSLSFSIPEIAKKTIPEFKDGIDFIVMIDEFENFLESQQRTINTILKFVKPGITFRIGTRPEGFKTFETTSKDDFIKEGRDYRKVIFEEVLIKDKGYQNFLKDVARKRLEQVKLFREKDFLDISKILGQSEVLEDEASKLTTNNPGKHFRLLKEIDSKDIKLLECKENPLLEMLNILWVLRKVQPYEVNKAMNEYLNGKKTDRAEKYKRDYVDKYKLSLMFLMASIYRKNKMYYSFNTFSFLSSGIVGHFIELCRNTFQYAEFENRDLLFQDGRILPVQQDKAAKVVADTELHMIQRIEEYGGLLYTFVVNLGNLFRDYHRDNGIKYPETNQFAVDKGTLDEKYKAAFNSALKWSVIQKKPALQQSAPGKHVKDIYTINRIFSPRFEISYRTRGGYSVELNKENVKYSMTETDVKLTPTRKKQKDKEENSGQQSFDF
ncbi:MAG: hypothetical protein WD607_04550 [Candidatus Paceibacterota bacterium]